MTDPRGRKAALTASEVADLHELYHYRRQPNGRRYTGRVLRDIFGVSLSTIHHAINLEMTYARPEIREAVKRRLREKAK